MHDHLYAVIMAGGKGERFWPQSTSRRPKQVLSLVGGKPLIQLAVERLEGLIPAQRVLVVTSHDLVDPIQKGAPQLPPENVIGEPIPRDTAAACALGMAAVQARDPQGVICTLTADHIIGDREVFHATLREGAELAQARKALVTIGITPTYPSSGYGYIEGDKPVEGPGRTSFVQAKRFVEKPDRETAARYIESGCFCWNSGMFIWSVPVFRDALKRYRPVLLVMADQMTPRFGTPEFAEVLECEYAGLEKISIDYAVMERADNIIMAKGTFFWDDVGAWPAIENHFPKDADHNVILGQGEAIDSSGNVVVSHERLTALIGVKDLVVIQAEGATLICPKERAQDVKQMVQRLTESGKYQDLL